jgi:cytochrome c-type biogenesis protein CcmH
MTFWVLTIALALIFTATMVLALLRPRRDLAAAASFDLQVYRDQLSEIEQDARSGKIPEDEAARLKTEISRRILAADSKVQSHQGGLDAKRPARVAMAAVIVAVMFGGGFALYTSLGAPGYGDMPLQDRVEQARELLSNRRSQQEAEAGRAAQAQVQAPDDYLALVGKLRTAVAARPDDLQGLRLLVRSEAALGNYVAAYQAQAQVVRLMGEEVSVKELTDLADMMVIAAGGYVSPETQEVLDRVRERAPTNGVARFYSGILMAQTGRPDLGFRIWDDLLRNSREGDPWVAPIQQEIMDLAFRAGVSEYTPPSPLGAAGPSEDDIANAADMTPQERAEMVRGMVNRLSERLAEEGGPPQDWARLISALVVIGEAEQARAIWEEAQTVFEQKPDMLEIVARAAREAGLSD